MGKLITKRPKEEYVAEVDWELLNRVAWVTLGFLVAAALVGGLTFHIVRWMVRPGPKVVVKVVHDSGLSSAQKAYIDQCRFESKVPDVHTNSWTCN